MLIYSSTPLITKKTVDQLVEYVSYKSSKCCKLPSGLIADTNYFINNSYNLFFDSIYSQNTNEFISINSDDELVYATQVLNLRLLNKHKLIFLANE